MQPRAVRDAMHACAIAGAPLRPVAQKALKGRGAHLPSGPF